MKSFLLALVSLLCVFNTANAQTPYNYTTEGFDGNVFPAGTGPAIETAYTTSTGTWGLFMGFTVTSTDPCPADGTNKSLRFNSSDNAYLISPTLPQGVATITFNDGRTNRIFTYYTSTDDGMTWSAGTNINSGPTTCVNVVITLNSAVINKVKIGSLQSNTMGLDNLIITPFTTNPPLVTTTAPSGITPVSATGGGNVTADGGAAVTARGVCWSTLPNPTTLDPKTIDGTGTGVFTSNITGLSASTTYHVRAYATNAIGTAYGADLSFTTLPPNPTLYVNPASLNFGYVYQGSFSAEQSYVVSGIFLSPAGGNITLTTPAGYQITTTSGTGYTSSLSLPYTGGTLNNTTIYVRFFPSTNGVYAGNITNSGGTAPTVNVAVTGTGTLLSPSGTLTNMGIDFWTAFGYHQRMQSSSGAGASLSLYISAQQATTVRVSMPGVADPTFPKTVAIPANSAVEVTGFPTGSGNIYNSGNTPDSRLYFTGITPRGIHIESLDGVPVAAYEHTYGVDCAGATLLFPTNTWGATYNVLALGGTSNTGIPNSFFFVMAKEDGTQIQITPTADIVDSSAATLFNDNTPAANIKYPAGVPFTITLNKGQVFNAMSRIVGAGSNNAMGQDLTGTLIKTIDCQNKKIAVWGGNGRTFMNTNGCTITSGSDNLIQQMLPKVAWGTKYLTTPTKTMEYGIYRIYVSSPAAQVKLNGVVLSPATLINNFYYQIETNQPSKIEADKPIVVSQFVVTANCKSAVDGNNGTSDPEMILLSPVQQAIKNASVFSASKLNIIASGGSSYINVILKNGGTAVSSFRMDGLSVCDTGASSFTAGLAYQSAGTISFANAFKPHPQDANYVYAKFKVTSGVSHNIISDSGFNAIAYGLVNGESYGYNAGTAIKDLSAIIGTHNPYDSISGSKTCKGNPATLEIALPYLDPQIDSIKWDATTNAAISPNGVYWDYNPTPIRTYVQDEVTYNVYQMPASIVFNAPGIYRLYATVHGTFASECGSVQTVPIDMEVVQDTAKFNFTPAACGSTVVTFTDQSVPHSGGSITQWLWNFGDATTSNVQNPPPHSYPAISVYNATLRVINDIGCYADTTRIIDLTGGLTAKYGVSPNDTVCSGTTIVFSDSSTSTGINGLIAKWHWNFGEGAPVLALTNANQSHTYNTPGIYHATLQVETASGCLSNIYDTVIVVNSTPVAAFTVPAQSCFVDSVQFTSTSTITIGAINQWFWDFGDPASGASNTSSLQNPKHKFSAPGTYTVTLYVASNGGCISPTATQTITINQQPTASFTFSSPTCAGKPVTFTSTSVPNSGILTTWYWDFGDGSKDTLFNGNPFNHIYSTGGTYTVTLKVMTDKGCVSNVASLPVTIRATPLANFALPGNLCLPNANASFTNTTTINDGTLPLVTYLWDFGDGSPTSTATNPSHVYTGTGPYLVKLTATSNNGCQHDTTKTLATIFAQPVANFNAPAEVCIGSTANFTDASTAAGSAVVTWSWNFGDPASGVNNTSSLQNPTHNFSAPGNYTVSLTVTNTQGCTSVAFTKPITINQKPTASFTFPAIRCAANSVAFTDASTANSGTVTGWSWNFGDPASGANNTSLLQNPTHIFATAGSYTVTLTVTNSKGCASILFSTPVTVNVNPVADFSVTNICIPNGSATFTDLSTVSPGTVTGWLWNFGDGSPTSNAQNPTHIYATGGSVPVSLTVTSNTGCTHVVNRNIPVYNTPVSSYTLSGSLCSNEDVTLTNTSTLTGFGTINKVEVYWDYVNDLTNKSTDNAPVAGGTYVHQYPTFGVPATKTYRVLLRTFSGNNCSHDYFTDVTIKAAPQVLFNPITPVCQEVTPFILNSASDIFGNPGVGVYSGAGITVSPLFSPASAGVGTHTIRYTYTAINGCSDYDDQTITVFPTPIINLGPDKKVIEGDAITLTPVTVIGTGLSYLWTPGLYLNGNTLATPISKPTDDITYVVTVVSADGCRATDDIFIKVVKDFIVPNIFTPNKDGINDTWRIDNLDLYPSHRVQIFNRYGQLLWESSNYTKPWDGRYKGKELPVGTYYYIIELGGARPVKKGYVTIVR